MKVTAWQMAIRMCLTKRQVGMVIRGLFFIHDNIPDRNWSYTREECLELINLLLPLVPGEFDKFLEFRS